MSINLFEAISRINEQPDDGILFVEPVSGEFQPESHVVVLVLSESELKSPVAQVAALRAPGKEYFLEVAIVRGFVENWQLVNPGEPLNLKVVQRIISYAVNDA